MIAELSIKNFAIIDDISINFYDGLTVLTGETGAGKSIIIDAVQLLIGHRGSVQYVRHGKKRAEIVGLFHIDKHKDKLLGICENYGIELEDDMIVLERTITNLGKSICRVNGKIVTLTILREFGQNMVTIHSQHDHMHLMDAKNHLPLLDTYISEKIQPVQESYTRYYNKYIHFIEQYQKLTENEQQNAQRIDLLQFQLTELEQAQLTENEDEYLLTERNQLQNFEKMYRAVHEAYKALYGEGKALEWIDIAQNSLQTSIDVDEQIQKQAEELTNIYYHLEEISFSLSNYNDTLHFDEARLNEIENRLNELSQLKRKYGNTVAEMMEYEQKIREELNTLQHKDTHIEQLETQIKEIEALAYQEAKKLRQIRKLAADALEKAMMQELQDLYLENATFTVHFKEQEKLQQYGIDHITFMLSTNTGEPVKELAKTASGGELSRIMLALKKIFAKHDELATVIFDEIDTGVSGRVAQAIAEKMYQISTTIQVLGITHLPQVAAMSDAHLLIKKTETNNKTYTNLKELKQEEKVNELGKMITGTKLTKTATEHAQELLELTKTFKASISKS